MQSYCRALRKFIEYLGHVPDQATEDHLRNYLSSRLVKLTRF
ncbi:MAG: hypothetical protein KDB03_23810 [Planctomycetales bacterium]|nr:hypothetical protein [Planctomycetales bacterium]